MDGQPAPSSPSGRSISFFFERVSSALQQDQVAVNLDPELYVAVVQPVVVVEQVAIPASVIDEIDDPVVTPPPSHADDSQCSSKRTQRVKRKRNIPESNSNKSCRAMASSAETKRISCGSNHSDNDNEHMNHSSSMVSVDDMPMNPARPDGRAIHSGYFDFETTQLLRLERPGVLRGPPNPSRPGGGAIHYGEFGAAREAKRKRVSFVDRPRVSFLTS